MERQCTVFLHSYPTLEVGFSTLPDALSCDRIMANPIVTIQPAIIKKNFQKWGGKETRFPV